MLEVRGISAFYGKHRALDGVSLDVGRGEIVVILGANGAGKTTLIRTIAGVLPLRSGGMTFGSLRIGPQEGARKGWLRGLLARR